MNNEKDLVHLQLELKRERVAMWGAVAKAIAALALTAFAIAWLIYFSV